MVHKKRIDIIGFPMDLGANRRGVDMGPSALRLAGLAEKLAALGYEVRDQGNISVAPREEQEMGCPKLKYASEIVRAVTMLASRVEKSLNDGGFALCIGGDHSMALGSLAGAAAHARACGQTLGVIWIDAHADMNTHLTTPSGNIHGMALAASLGVGAPELTGLGGLTPTPKVLPQHVALVGVRSIDGAERDQVTQLPELLVSTMTDIDRRGMYEVTRELLSNLAREVDHLHVSFDVDAVDPSVAPGVGTPVSGGLTYREAHLLMEMIAESGPLASMDVVEVNPILDTRNQSAKLAVDLVGSVLGKRIL